MHEILTFYCEKFLFFTADKLLREDLEQEGWRSGPPQISGVTRAQHVAEGEYKDKKKEKTFRKNGFHNFQERSYDYDELECMLLNTNPV